MYKNAQCFFLVAAALAAAQSLTAAAAPIAVERSGRYEVVLHGPVTDNPFTDSAVRAEFRFEHRTINVDGFYDGGGIWRVRFMPDEIGEWSYVTHSSTTALNGATGTFKCITPSAGNHGPVAVSQTYHFVYADGTRYVPLGTTSYAWTHQGDRLEQLTLATLSRSPFNKIRLCVFPKSYDFNHNEPQYYPFVRNAAGDNDFTRFNPRFFQHLELRIDDLRALGIEADLILFHPYDRWGYAKMPADADDRYLRYVVARLSSFRNIWWSMANEYDFMKAKTMSDWDRFFRIVNPTADNYYPNAAVEGRYYLYYFDASQPAEYQLKLPAGTRYRAELIDPWAMTVTNIAGAVENKSKLQLPGRPYLAVRLIKVD